MSPYYVNVCFDTILPAWGAYVMPVDYADRAHAAEDTARLERRGVKTLYRIKVTMKVPA